MNEENIKAIKDQVKRLVKKMIDIGGDQSPEILDLISQVIAKAQQKINTLREEEKKQVAEQPIQGANTNAPSNDAQLLWILSGQQPQAFISYLRNYPTPATQQLLNNPAALNATITQLNQMMPQGELPVVNGVPHADLNSSNIWGATYDPESARMRVRFQGGAEYEYDGVPENIFKAFIRGNAAARTKGKNKYGEWWVGKNPSLGAAMNQYIKAGGFPYQRVA